MQNALGRSSQFLGAIARGEILKAFFDRPDSSFATDGFLSRFGSLLKANIFFGKLSHITESAFDGSFKDWIALCLPFKLKRWGPFSNRTTQETEALPHYWTVNDRCYRRKYGDKFGCFTHEYNRQLFYNSTSYKWDRWVRSMLFFLMLLLSKLF